MLGFVRRPVVAALAAILMLSPAYAQQGGGGGQGGPPSTPPGGGMTQPDRDQDRDRLSDQDRDRLRDQDRLYLGTQDRIRLHDTDRDGRISGAEFTRWHEQNFSAFDADGNGGISRQEYLALRLGAGPQGGLSERRRVQMDERSQLRKAERFRLMDGNGDGAISRNEYMNFGELNYLDADADDNGLLTWRELQRFHRGM